MRSMCGSTGAGRAAICVVGRERRGSHLVEQGLDFTPQMAQFPLLVNAPLSAVATISFF